MISLQKTTSAFLSKFNFALKDNKNYRGNIKKKKKKRVNPMVVSKNKTIAFICLLKM